jgi:hypothetical protein
LVYFFPFWYFVPRQIWQSWMEVVGRLVLSAWRGLVSRYIKFSVIFNRIYNRWHIRK